jgi:TraM recognition site of TraD and TraG
VLPELQRILGKRQALVWRDLHWPSSLDVDASCAILRQLAADHFVSNLVVETEAVGGVASYRLGVPAPSARRVEQLFASIVPGSVTTTTTSREPLVEAWRVVLTSRTRPLKTGDSETTVRALLAAMVGAKSDERVVVQWVLGPTRTPRPAPPQEAKEPQTGWRVLVAGSRPIDSDARRAIAIKRSDFSFVCVGRIGVVAASRSRRSALAVGLLAALRTASSPGVTVRLVREPEARVHDAYIPFFWPYALNVNELVPLFAWPLGNESLPGVPRDQSRWLRPDERIPRGSRLIGLSNAPGEDRLLGLSIEDARHHLHVIGPTGVGKSTLLAQLILQDVGAGRSVVVVEPKGDLSEDVIARLPSNRVSDVVVLDPSDHCFPVGLNPLLPHGRSPELIADQVLAVFHGLWASNWGPRLQDILHSSLLTLAGREDASLCLLPALLTNPVVRQRLRASVDDPVALEPFWAWFDSISDAERQQSIAPVLNKLRPFLLRRSVRAIVGQVQPRFHIDEVFTKRKIVLVSLAKGLIGPEAAALLGSLFIAELWQAILGRAHVSPAKRHVVTVFLDEFQDYVHLPTDMSDALAQARGLGIGLTLAHQHLAQLPAALRASVLANARSRICFQLAGDDAQTMARLSDGQLEPKDFQRLRRFEAYAQLMASGETINYASFRTLPLPDKTVDSTRVRSLSRQRYGRPLEAVDAEIRRMLDDPTAAAALIGRRRRQP